MTPTFLKREIQVSSAFRRETYKEGWVLAIAVTPAVFVERVHLLPFAVLFCCLVCACVEDDYPRGFSKEKVRSAPFTMLFCCLLSACVKDDYPIISLVLLPVVFEIAP